VTTLRRLTAQTVPTRAQVTEATARLRAAVADLAAPTAGGKTEAAVLPLLSRAQLEGWSGLSMLYLCPLRALLNNLHPRLGTYAQWLGRRARVWHGDTPPTQRRRIVDDPPDLLLTTPESLESMLVSSRTDPHAFLGTVRAVVVDEIHAFAGDDRGVHLRSLLGRLTRIAPQPIQRIGLSATVGNPDELLGWLTASAPGPRRVLAPSRPPAPVSAGFSVVFGVGGGAAAGVVAFSSPGSAYSGPSHGIRKSKLRKSCGKLTGS